MKRHLLTSLLIVAFLLTVQEAFAFNLWDAVNPWEPPAQYWENINLGGPVTEALHEAADQWTIVGNSNFSFQYEGTTTNSNCSMLDDQVLIRTESNGAPYNGGYMCKFNADNGTVTLGFAYSWGDPNSTNGCLVICLKAFASDDTSIDVNWFVGTGDQKPAEDQRDFASVVTHEMGHILGLDHSCDDTPNDGIVNCADLDDDDVKKTATMNYAYQGIIERTINDDDIAGIQAIYGVFNADIDGDGISNENDNCSNVSNIDQSNADGDSQGDACDDDDDGDGKNDAIDNCPLVANPNQKDSDKDGTGDVCDDDNDGDGLSNEEENKIGTDPFKADTDGDGLTDFDEVNGYGTDPLSKDTDGDAIDDAKEIDIGTDPLKKDNPVISIVVQLILSPDDTDSDGIDDDNDNCPFIANPDQSNADGDIFGDACDIGAMLTFFDLKKYNLYWPLTRDQACGLALAGTGHWPEWCDEKEERR